MAVSCFEQHLLKYFNCKPWGRPGGGGGVERKIEKSHDEAHNIDVDSALDRLCVDTYTEV